MQVLPNHAQLLSDIKEYNLSPQLYNGLTLDIAVFSKQNIQ